MLLPPDIPGFPLISSTSTLLTRKVFYFTMTIASSHTAQGLRSLELSCYRAKTTSKKHKKKHPENNLPMQGCFESVQTKKKLKTTVFHSIT